MQHLPLTVKRSLELLGLVLLALIISEGRQIITPLVMAFFSAIVLLPVYRLFRRIKIPEIIAIILSLLVLIILVGIIIFFISTQVKPLINDFGQIKQNITIHINDISNWISEKFNVSTTEQAKFISDQSQQLVDSAGNLLGGMAGSIGSVIIFFGLFPIYTFLVLFYKDIIKKFILHWFPIETHPEVKQTLHQAESILISYIGGLLIQITYITILLGGALMLFGIPHAMLIGIIFAILNLIPYIGALFGNILGVLLTLSSSADISPVVTVLLAIAAVQFLDNNILMPSIVGSKVKINALASLVGVFVGGALAGIPGMFLSLPLIAVFKIIFDHTLHLKQWGILFGDERPGSKGGLFKKRSKN